MEEIPLKFDRDGASCSLPPFGPRLQVFNEFNARHTERINIFRNLISNHVFLGVIAFTVVVQALLVQSGGFVGRIASTTPLSLKFWGLCVALGFLSMPIAAILKCVPVPKKAMFARSKTMRRHDGGSEYHALPDGAHNGESSSA
jgi:Ca2+-transporting ATPase